MFLKLMKIAGWLVLVIFIAGTLAFTVHQSENVVCRKIQIDYRENEAIRVGNDELVRLVKSADSGLLSKKLKEINAEEIEKVVETHQAVLKADVYKLITKDSSSFRGVLVVKVKHREPVVRIMANTGSYYLDELGGKIPISSKYTANVLVATGFITQEFAAEKLLPFVLSIENNEFWKAQIEQIHVDEKQNIILTPLVGNHFIELGEIDGFQTKMKKMKAFYEQVMAKNNWEKYKSVSLEYNNQVIAKRR